MALRIEVIVALLTFILTSDSSHRVFVGGSTITASHSDIINTNQNGNIGMGANINFMIEWSRNMESTINRLGTRMELLFTRMDHLDSRLGRVQSLVQMSFDNFKNGLTASELRTDLWGEKLNRIEEELSRKWKNVETQFDSLIHNVDTKMESKFNSIQRDNRRHNEILQKSYNNVVFSNERLEKSVSNSVSKMNDSLNNFGRRMKSECELCVLKSEEAVASSDKGRIDLYENITKKVISSIKESTKDCTGSQPRGKSLRVETPSQSSSHLLSSKVTNMFEEILTKNVRLERSIRDLKVITNSTRRDVQDGFRSLFSSQGFSNVNSQHFSQPNPINYHNNNNNNNRYFTSSPYRSQGGGLHSNYGHNPTSLPRYNSGAMTPEMISAVIIEALASTESMSNALGMRITELSRSIAERFEIVSNTLNGFLESCLRIQEGSPLIEEHIAGVLEKILDAVENSTSSASKLWIALKEEISDETKCYKSSKYKSNHSVDTEYIEYIKLVLSSIPSHPVDADNNDHIFPFHDTFNDLKSAVVIFNTTVVAKDGGVRVQNHSEASTVLKLEEEDGSSKNEEFPQHGPTLPFYPISSKQRNLTEEEKVSEWRKLIQSNVPEAL